jgi:glycosyltransferase involved in cell wall biosynthesis
VRILHIGKYYQPYSGGIENFMKALMEESVSQGHQVSAVVHDHTGGKLSKSEDCDQVEIYRAKSLGQILYAPIAPSFYSVTQRVIRDFKPDILHLHMPNLSVFLLLIMNAAKEIPWVVHWHSDVEFDKKQGIAQFAYNVFYSRLEAKVLKLAKSIIATSPPYLESSAAIAPYINKCLIVPLGLSSDTEDVMLNGDTLPTEARKPKVIRLLTVGRLSHYKGHMILLEALARLPQVYDNFQLDIVGAGELGPFLSSQVKRLKLESCVNLVGYVSDPKVRQHFRDCDVFCLTSTNRSEAFGLVLLEAFRVGKPCLVSDVEGSGMKWVVGDGREGWHFENKNVESLAKKLTYIASNNESITELGDNALKRYNAIFKIDKINLLIEEAYREILNGTLGTES